MVDSLVECPLCKSMYCYQQIHEGLASWKCLSCGYTTNSNMMVNTEIVKAHEMTLPRLYKEIRKIDDSGLVWYPQVVDKTQDGKGALFAFGTEASNWLWAFSPSVIIPSDEVEKFRNEDGTYNKYKRDIFNIKYYKRNEFALALNELELF